ncbi:hypothetical protein V5799_009513 [Amblyomma americanum]|uniref:Peptidase M13 C-terminal domain-containing protein n=1 Tax=Amblyomma americanum TaxID=6943 RepID=A0AAQ4FBH0_AMBAM
MGKLKAHIGSPGQKLDENYMNQYYARFPDIPPNGSFFGGWLKTRSALVHQKWTDQTNAIFSISRLTSYYVYEDNVVIIPAGALLPVFFPADGNAVLNYAKLGNDLAHKIMKAFDRTGILYDENGQVNPWNTTATVQRYIFNMRCLHHSHEKAGYSPLDLPLNETVASENVADLAAATTAHAAYQMLHTSERSNTLPGLNITAEELYFIGRCTDACKYKNYTDTPAGHLSRPSSRCEVPAMNMEAFAQTYGCSAQARMNPSPKCSVW